VLDSKCKSNDEEMFVIAGDPKDYKQALDMSIMKPKNEAERKPTAKKVNNKQHLGQANTHSKSMAEKEPPTNIKKKEDVAAREIIVSAFKFQSR
jgi:hypothetical protein